MPRTYEKIKYVCNDTLSRGKYQKILSSHRGTSGQSMAKLMNMQQQCGRSAIKPISLFDYLEQIFTVLSEKNLTRNELAKKLNISEAYLSSFCKLYELPQWILMQTFITRPRGQKSSEPYIAPKHLIPLAMIYDEIGDVRAVEIFEEMLEHKPSSRTVKEFIKQRTTTLSLVA